MSRQKDGEIPSLEELSTIQSSKLEQADARQRTHQLKHLKGLIKAADTAATQAERRDRNARIAINRLPAEVLEEIFVMSCTVKLAGYKFWRYQYNDIITVWNPIWIHTGGAVRLMRVCHHWNEIALGTRELWNSVETYCGDRDHVSLARSIRGPLKVLACGEPQYAVAHALQNAQHSSRIQELYWTRPTYCKSRNYLGMPAPSLRSLALQGDWSRTQDGSFNLFDNHTPCLERLSLSAVNWLPSNAFAKLTFLALNKCNAPKAPIKLRCLLAGTPNLVDLILRNVSDNSYRHIRVEIEAAGMKPVSLTRLRRLLIANMWADDIDYVFWDARLNGDVSVSIKRMKRHGDGNQVLDLLSTWSLNVLKQPKELDFQSDIVIVAGASSSLRFQVEESMSLEDWTGLNWPWILTLSSISQLYVFELFGCDPCRGSDLEHMRAFLRQMTALETLSVDIEVLTKIVDALTLFRDPIDPPLCPALTTLRIAIRRDSDCNIILDLVLPHRAQLGIRHLYIGLVDPPSGCWRPLQAVKDQLHANFESVKFDSLWCDKAYSINLPLVCDEEAHALWPPWL
ncbi:uncharacterized protein LAESUDRAFT_763347 [Laetiporus sulphureus 93-53]|uniref:Uncharacterized protein n=1 Tax=Laetiporus sulphureus 93-53 TaxID=1314785 RepID=A0A165BZ43_9APHY|nr:uncharacterized protein LAESUDRAFT_763347 [Laetiporus sulphureus 93-53]KZT01912.1 hypothetical protein LAESUDRAFT_763347 [Laetiporus sulphureus 93-53]